MLIGVYECLKCHENFDSPVNLDELDHYKESPCCSFVSELQYITDTTKSYLVLQ